MVVSPPLPTRLVLGAAASSTTFRSFAMRSAESATGVPDGRHTFDANMPGVALHVPALDLYLNHVVRNAVTRWHSRLNSPAVLCNSR
eukprot:CAMPEP_0179409624 /NCGR_PEP_ID=MMETSP0799-20121207/2809_1 /TAXON_ID=46947 /ORGANISM="Geminigera cryophila, Strain CCMP2564" /LENGTH=86 /DNA_ID=CAMNT_0021181331 /DNA_START=118 /DNA_END=378 /DNA_ORIENTATION=+